MLRRERMRFYPSAERFFFRKHSNHVADETAVCRTGLRTGRRHALEQQRFPRRSGTPRLPDSAPRLRRQTPPRRCRPPSNAPGSSGCRIGRSGGSAPRRRAPPPPCPAASPSANSVCPRSIFTRRAYKHFSIFSSSSPSIPSNSSQFIFFSFSSISLCILLDFNIQFDFSIVCSERKINSERTMRT